MTAGLTPASRRLQSAVTATFLGVLEIVEAVSTYVSWWMILFIALVLLGTWWYVRHPGVKAKRDLRVAVTRGNERRAAIRQTTARTKAEMARIARDYRRRRR